MKNKTKNILCDIFFIIVVIMMIYLFVEFSFQYVFEISFGEYLNGLK